MSGISREPLIRKRIGIMRIVLALASTLSAAVGAAPAQAQDLVHRFIDPSFGGNPFYSDHLLAIANLDRPAQPTTPTTTPTQEDLIAQQLQARLLSTLSGNILDSINNAKVGDTGNFTLGNQTISFTRSATATTVTFTNTATGEVNTVVIPAAPATSSSLTGVGATTASTGASTAATTTTLQAARAAAAATSTNIAVSGSLSSVTATGVVANPSAEQVLSASLGASGATGAVLPPF